MTDRLILELKNKFRNELSIQEENHKDGFLNKNNEINKMLDDLQLTLQSLNYKNKEIKNVLPVIIKESSVLTQQDKNISFEDLLKLAMKFLDNENSNVVR